MTKARSATPAVPAAAPPAGGLWQSWVRFWFAPADPIGLHALRVLAGLLFLAWLLPFAGHVEEFFGLGGWFDRQAYIDAGELPGGPPQPVSWSVLYLIGDDPLFLKVVYWLSLGIITLFALGLWTRLTGVLTWVIVCSFTANPATAYDADPLLVMLAFYLMVGYLLFDLAEPRRSWLKRLLGSRETWLFRRSYGAAEPSRVANLAVRLLQVHFAVAMLANGLHKLQYGDWWGGVAYWFPLYPPFEATMEQARAQAPQATELLFVLSLLAYLTLAWQLAFPFFAWRRRWRPVLLGGALAGWAGLAFLYRLPLFGPIYVIGCLSYLTPAEWHRLGDLLARVAARLRRLVGSRPSPAARPAAAGAAHVQGHR
jgi:hypothetical protein